MKSGYFGYAGLCTNGSCPYRHVNVNKEAPICEAFLQGYCTDGDKVTHTMLGNAVLFGSEMSVIS
jgi:hypothetical protein